MASIDKESQDMAYTVLQRIQQVFASVAGIDGQNQLVIRR